MEIDIERLRKDLIDYFGAATFGPFPNALADLTEVENASANKLIEIAKRNGFNLNKYKSLYR